MLLIEQLLVRIANREHHDQADKKADWFFKFLGGEFHMYDSPKWIISSDFSKILSQLDCKHNYNFLIHRYIHVIW